MLNEEQKKIRKTGVGGSDMAPIAGLSKTSPLDIYLFKIGETEDIPEDECSVPMWLGKELEPIYRKRFIMETGFDVIVPTSTFRHEKYSWMIANVDGIIPSEKAILEIKHVSHRSVHRWGKSGSDEIPEEGLLQSSHYRKCYEDQGIEKVYVFACLGGGEFRHYTYNTHNALEKKVVDLSQDFWTNNVLERIPPSIKHREDALKMWPLSEEKKITANDDILKCVQERESLRLKIKEMEDKKEWYEKEIYTYLKDASLLEDEEGRKLASWRSESFTRFDTTAFKEKHPDLHKEFTKQTLIRRLRISA